MVKNDYITSYNPYFGCSNVTADFTASPTTGDAPLTVDFTNNSSGLTPPLTYEWDFDNDGTVDSTADNPSFTYTSVSNYTVKLTATDPYGRSDTETKTDYIFVKIGSVPAVDFTGSPTSGSSPLTVNFNREHIRSR
jgi:PKD repeat protein